MFTPAASGQFTSLTVQIHNVAGSVTPQSLYMGFYQLNYQGSPVGGGGGAPYVLLGNQFVQLLSPGGKSTVSIGSGSLGGTTFTSGRAIAIVIEGSSHIFLNASSGASMFSVSTGGSGTSPSGLPASFFGGTSASPAIYACANSGYASVQPVTVT